MKPIISFLIILFTINFVSSGQTDTIPDTKEIDDYFKKMAKDWNIPSMAIGIVKDGKLVFEGYYGVLETGKKVKPDKNTLYAIASNTKAFTATIMAMLVQEGKLNWDDKVKDHLPYFEVYDPWVSNHVTIKDILSHRVGLGTFHGDIMWLHSDLTSEELIKSIKHLPKDFEFRSGYGYSNLMYVTAGEIIKKVTGKSWNENVKEKILIPLKMNRSISSLNDLEKMGNYAIPHTSEEGENVAIEWEDWEEVGATGGIISSVDDMTKWIIFNLNKGINGEDTLLTSNNLNLLWTPHNNFYVDHSNDYFKRHFNAYGLGWFLSDYKGKFRVSHGGAYGGMISALTMIPDEKLGVVVLTNGMSSPAYAAALYALDAYLNNDYRDWNKEFLEYYKNWKKNDTRISDRKGKRILNTKPSFPVEKYTGKYKSDIYGIINISLKNEKLRIDFEHSPRLSATLSHWHFDVWEIKWDYKHAWFTFGTVKFQIDNNMNIKGLEFDVPNDDFFFEELKPYKLENEKHE